MKIEIKYYKVSIIVIFMMMMLSFIILNGLAYLLFTILFKVPFEELYNKVWIILVFIPLTQGLIQPLTDRKGLLTIKNCNSFQLTHEKIGRLLVKKGYRELSKKDNSSTFELISNFK